MAFNDEDKRLLLRSALAKPEDAIAAFRAWCLRNTVYDAPYSASRLFPLVYQNIGPLIADKETADRLRGMARHTWLGNNLRIRLCATALESLAQRNISTLLLKGAALTSVVTKDSSVRQMGDCDILVPHDEAENAVACLLATGLKSVPLDASRFGPINFREFHGATFNQIGGDIDVIDLHWRPLREVGCPELTGDFFRSATPTRFAEKAVLAPSAELILFHIAMHGSAWEAEDRFDWIADLSMILRSRQDAFDWNAVIAIARKYGCGAMLSVALKYAQTIGDTAIPQDVITGLRAGTNFLDRHEARERMKGEPDSAIGKAVDTFQKLKRRKFSLVNRSLFRLVPTLALQAVHGDSDPIAPTGNSFYEADFIYGWHSAEPGGRWSNGTFAYLRFPNDPALGLHKLIVSFHVLDRYADSLEILIGRKRVSRIDWSENDPRLFFRAIDIPASERKRRWIRVSFRLRQPLSPEKLGVAKDRRTLGIFLRDIRILPPRRDVVTNPLDLTSSSPDAEYLREGWSFAEPSGRWTDGAEATMSWQAAAPVPQDAMARLNIASFFPPTSVEGSLLFNGHHVLDFEFSESKPSSHLEFPLPVQLPAGATAEVKVQIKKPASPAELGFSKDTRKLGLFVHSLHIRPAADG